jgi:hypothetical protein
MATIEDICTGALQKLGIIAGNETPSANDAGFCLSELNDMMAEMPAQQIYLNWATLALADTFPLADVHVGGVKAMLAVRVSPAFGGDSLLSSVVVKQADEGYSRLFGDYHRPDELAVDDALQDMPGIWNHGIDNVNV